MRTFHRPFPPLVPLLLLAALAACDQRAPNLPTGPLADPGGAGVAPLIAVGPDAIPGRYVVVMDDSEVGTSAQLATEVVAAHGGKVHYTYEQSIRGFAATLTPAAVDALRRNPHVKYVAQDAMAHPDQTTQPGATWGLDRVDQRNLPLNTTYVYSRTGAGVRVYVIDTGIRTSHAEFGGRASVGTDLVGDGQNGQDCNGHGTHVAGTIAGTAYGVAKAAQVIAVRVFGCTGGAEYSTIIAAVEWVTANAVKPAVANMSLGGPAYTPLNTAVQASIASGVVYAVSAGNDNVDACQKSPASTPQAVTVASSVNNDTRSSFSNYGTCVDLFAPGSGITSAWYTSNTATNTISGTSMASPHVAGVAALYLQGAPTATPAAVAAALVTTSTAGRLTGIQTGSPNRLLYSRLTAETPGGIFGLNPGTLSFTFVRTVAGAAAEESPALAEPQPFAASAQGEPKAEAAGMADGHLATATSSVLSSQVTLSNPGTAALNWTAASNRTWLALDPGNGRLTNGYTALLNATVNAASLAAGTHAGTVSLADPGATNSPVSLNVTVNVVNAAVLAPGTPRTGLAGASGSQAYYVVTVPPGATSLSISTTGGAGDADLYVRYGQPPTYGLYDCRPYSGGNVETCQVSNPAPGTYYVMLHGFSAYSGVTLAAVTGGPPAAPANLKATPATLTSITLRWTDGSVNETGFTVSRRALVNGAWGPWTDVGTPAANATAFTNTGLTAGGSYLYRLRACNAAGCSAWINGTQVTLPTAPPAAPFGLAAAATSGTAVGLTWTDGSSDETRFELARALRNLDGTWGAYAALTSPAANATSYTNSGLLAGRTYRYQLRACNPAGCSGWTISNIVALPAPPAAPTTIAGTVPSAGTIRVQWTDASSNERSFQLARAPVSAAGVVGAFTDVATLAAGQVVYVNTGLAPGTYRYRVRSCNVAGCSAWTVSGSVTIPPIPAAPTTLTATALSATTIRVTWVDASPVETSYQVQRALRNLDGTWPAFGNLSTLAANTTVLNNAVLSGRTYRYQVRACNISGCSAYVQSPIVSTP